jgi:hypothetical protein
MLESIVLERIELARDLEDDAATPSAVAAIGTTAGDVFLASKAEGAGAPVTALDEDLDAVGKR